MVSFLSSTFGVFLSVLCDNLLLTVVVPILPELLREREVQRSRDSFANVSKNHSISSSSPSSVSEGNGSAVVESAAAAVAASAMEQSCIKQLFHLQLLNENSELGILFSTKAIVQLLCNPLVGSLTVKIGYKVPLCIGNFILFLCSLVFGFADSYALFLVGRSFHGLASSLVAISGMALVAELYQSDEDRTRFLGRTMGAAALGVLIGYPFGGFFYAFVGKAMPFLSIALLALFNTGFHMSKIRIEWISRRCNGGGGGGCLRPKVIDASLLPTSSWGMLKDKSILIISIAIWLSTMAMAVLEPTLPVWLIDNIDPPKWQLGLVFVPDSLGYFVGTNFFGQVSLQFGRWKTSMISMAAIGTACFILPMGKMVWQLALPHCALGLGLGIVDASLMPLLAKIADESYHAGYGAVYALAQTSVALAYALGPLIGGQLVPVIGFADLMRCVGILNLLFCPFLMLLCENQVHHALPGSVVVSNYNNNGGGGGGEGTNLPIQSSQDPRFLPHDDEIPMKIMNKYIQPASHHHEHISLYQRFYDDMDWD